MKQQTTRLMTGYYNRIVDLADDVLKLLLQLLRTHLIRLAL